MTTTADPYRIYKPRTFNATTRQRFFRHRRQELSQHVGGAPSQAQLILIERIIRNEWDLYRLDAQLDVSDLSAHNMRARFAMENRLRLDLRDLGLRGAAAKQPSLAEYLAERAARPPGGTASAA